MLLRRLFPCVWGSEWNVPKPSVAVKFMTSNSRSPSKTSMRGSVLQRPCSHSEYRIHKPLQVQITSGLFCRCARRNLYTLLREVQFALVCSILILQQPATHCNTQLHYTQLHKLMPFERQSGLIMLNQLVLSFSDCSKRV